MASIAERVAMACVKTVVTEDKHLFLGELSMSYLSSAPISVSHQNIHSRFIRLRRILIQIR